MYSSLRLLSFYLAFYDVCQQLNFKLREEWKTKLERWMWKVFLSFQVLSRKRKASFVKQYFLFEIKLNINLFKQATVDATQIQ